LPRVYAFKAGSGILALPSGRVCGANQTAKLDGLEKGNFMSKLCGAVLGLLLLSGVAANSARAQFKNGSQATELNLPRLSQRAEVIQRIGLTDVTILYHAPLAGQRELFGKTVPYGQVWRAGANENTTIAFTDDVSIEGHALSAGTYGLHMIPKADEWTIIFSKNFTSWGSFSYDEKEDALRVNVKPVAEENRDSLAYTFDDIKPDSAAATLRWGKVAVPFRISVDVNTLTERAIRNQLRNTGGFTWAGYDEAANWNLDQNYKLEDALKWEETSIQNEERFENLETKSRILEAMGKKTEAEAALKQALDKANAIQMYVYARGLQRQKQQDKAFELYRRGYKQFPDHWISHIGMARIDSSTGKFDDAVKEMKLAIAAAPDQQKTFLQPMLKRLENKDDINK
jgi:tetratricopeptide (TPR) repeat protein